MSKSKPLSPHQREAVALAQEGGGRLVRLPGGYWTIEGSKVNSRGVPERYILTLTISAIVKRGLAAYTKKITRSGWVFDTEITLTQPRDKTP